MEYLCPACGNPYYGSSVGSYSVFHFVKFSDGDVRSELPSELWLTRCPRCRQFFSKKHLFKIPLSPRAAQFIRYDRMQENDRRAARATDGEKRNRMIYGSLDYTLGDGESAIDFLEEAIECGLYFPVSVNEYEKRALSIDLLKTLWWEYNKKRIMINREKYNRLCENLAKILEGADGFCERDLMLAELYRNIGNFEESRKYLDAVRVSDKNKALVDCINEQINIRNTKTVIVEQS